MSHLPLDARAILHYLNELGYRNISAVQLKEFLKGMQPQSDNDNKCKFKDQQQHFTTTPTTRNTTTTTTTRATTESASILRENPTPSTTAATALDVSKRSPAVKVVKCKKPLCHFKFYLDIRDHQLTKRIEDQIKQLGGSLEFFLTPSVTHFITDKPIIAPAAIAAHSNPNNSQNPVTPQTPKTPLTPQTSYSLECLADSTKPNNGLANKKPVRNSRADAILNRARRQSTINVSTPTTSQPLKARDPTVEPTSNFTPLKHQDNPTSNDIGTSTLHYVVWQCENAVRFFKKVQHELKDYLGHSNKTKNKSYGIEPISLKGGFIKFESIKRNYRPYYHLFKKPQEWPKVQLSREDGAFRLSPKKDLPLKELKEVDKIPEALNGVVLVDTMTRKSRTKSSQNHHNLKNKVNNIAKSAANSQKHSGRCKNQTAQHQKDSSDKQCGVCEICKIEYDALTIHLKTKDHEYFAKNSQNFIALDSLIHSSADVNKFLDENRKLEIKTELEEMEVEHEGLTVMEQDPLQHSENENDGDDDNDAEEDDEDDQSQVSSSTTKRKSVEPKIFSPTLREKSKRSTKGKHSSEKFQNCTLTAKTPKAPSPQKVIAAFDVKTNLTRRKPSSTAAVSPPIRAMLPPSSMYKVVETLTEVNCTPPRGKGAAASLKGESKIVGSPSIIVKFKKVRNTELEVLNGEAENFMFPKKRNDSSELPTDVDRQTTSDRVQRTQSSQIVLTSSSSSEEQDPEDEFEVKRKPTHLPHNGKKAIVKAKRRLSKKCSSSTSKVAPGGECKQSFPKTPIQPIRQLKSERNPTTAITARTKRKSIAVPQSRRQTKCQNVVATAATVSNKTVLPEATRKSSRTATAIVTAATTSTRLLQAAVEAAKSKHKLETSTKSKLPPSLPIVLQYPALKRHKIKQEVYSNSEQEDDDNADGNDVLNKPKSRAKALRCSRKSVVKMEDRMGDAVKKPKHFLNERKLIHGFDAEDYEDGDITMDDEEEDDDNDADFVVQSPRTRNKMSSKSAKNLKNHVSPAMQMSVQALKPLAKSRRSAKTQTLTNLSVREERLARRQSRLITQLQLELQTASEEETCKEFSKPKNVEKKLEKSTSKTSSKSSKSETSKKSPAKATSPAKHEPSPPKTPSKPSRYFDHTKSERIKSMRYAFERLPAADLWYRVYKRQDNYEEKYFEYFGSTKYRKLPYELGPIPFDSTLMDHNRHKMSCKLCEDVRLKKECDKVKKLHVRRELQLDLKSEQHLECLSKSNSLEAEDHDCSSSSRHDKHVLNNADNDKDQDQKHSKLNSSSHAAETKSYVHKHKKLHLLQRYRQELEQQELLQRQKLEDQANCGRLAAVATDIKTENVTQDGLLSRNYRAGSAHSNSSSCASSTHTNCKSKKMRNKLLNKVSFLANLELPPRKSPREHASTLALVSCIIKQRQDSLSKPNSETDEPPATSAETESKVLMMAAEKLKSRCEVFEKEPPKTPPPSAARVSSVESPLPNVTNSPRTRSQAATPIEELRFTTEISETVKRMRRGRNKYDYSPPFVKRTSSRPSSARGRGAGATKSVVNLFRSSHHKAVKASTSALASISTRQRSNTPNIKKQLNVAAKAVNRGRRRRGRQKGYNNKPKSPTSVLTSIRKTGSKKGVLEFDVDNVAIEALRKATTDYLNPKLLEWQIDKFLTLANKQYENDLLLDAGNGTTPSDDNALNGVQTSAKPENALSSVDDVLFNTPPATDYFSSDFDLCDIINQSSDRLQEEGDNAGHLDRRIKKFSIFNTVHLNKYYRKRKNPKSNRTGWPKAPKKKAATRQQSMKDKIYFLQNGIIREEKCENHISIRNRAIRNNEEANEDDTTQEQTRESGVITPPDSVNGSDDNGKQHTMANEDDEESLLMEEESQMGLNDDSQTAIGDDDDDDEEEEEEEEEDNCDEEEEHGTRIIEEDEETLADTVDDDDEEDEEEEEHMEQKADSDADADIEEADEDERSTRRGKVQHKCLDKKFNRKCKKIIPRIIENEDEDSYEPQEKRRCGVLRHSPADKVHTNLLNPNSNYTTTPSTPFLRALRRTPQLNGSLGSCISPSEKAGDNSDIFTVSSDGLDTDMDLSNSQSQLRSANAGFDDDDLYHHQHNQHNHHHHHHHNSSLHHSASTSTLTPRRKFDISKYAPTNAITCAAEAATAAVKSLAISQFLKKEVRVTCRRLRAPFRRFRYRR